MLKDKSNPRYAIAAAFVLAALTATSCGHNGAEANASLSIKSDNAAAKSNAGQALLIVDTVKVLITRLKFDGSGGDSTDVRSGPFVVDLDLSGSVKTVASAHVSEGVYTKVKFELHKPDVNESVPDQDFRTGSGGDERFSVVVIGRSNGIRFVYRSKVVINESIDISPPLVVADTLGAANVTLIVNPSLMFLKNALVLDVTDTTASNVSAIDNSIKAAFITAFRDDAKVGTGQ